MFVHALIKNIVQKMHTHKIVITWKGRITIYLKRLLKSISSHNTEQLLTLMEILYVNNNKAQIIIRKVFFCEIFNHISTSTTFFICFPNQTLYFNIKSEQILIFTQVPKKFTQLNVFGDNYWSSLSLRYTARKNKSGRVEVMYALVSKYYQVYCW